MRLLVIGSQGQVARALVAAAGPPFTIVALGRPDCDLTRPDTIEAAIARHRPEAVINAAAYTAVDKAEQESDLAFAINAVGAGNAAAAAARAGLPFIHISTDYVFPGDATEPYREDDATGPLGVYGRSKLEGEEAVAAANADHVTLRTAWVHSAHGSNFLKTMLRLAAERPTIRVVGDQRGTPTYAGDIADAILTIAATMAAAPDAVHRRGTFHCVNSGATDWASFATEIFRQSRERGGPGAAVERITTAEYPTPARRPASSVLDTSKLRKAFGITMPDWRVGLSRCLDAIATEP